MVSIIVHRNNTPTGDYSRTSVYGDQPRSLNINWMKYDVTDENVDPQKLDNKPIKLSPIRQKLRERGEQVLQKRQLLTT